MATYRPFRLEDREVATHLITEVFREILGRDISKYVRDEIARFLAEFDPKRDWFLVAEEGGEIVGTVLVDHSNPESGVCNMQFLAVRPDHRGHGHGHDMITKGIEFAKSAGYRSVELIVMPEFEHARRMYEAMGFKHVDTYLWQGSNVLTFERDV